MCAHGSRNAHTTSQAACCCSEEGNQPDLCQPQSRQRWYSIDKALSWRRNKRLKKQCTCGCVSRRFHAADDHSPRADCLLWCTSSLRPGHLILDPATFCRDPAVQLQRLRPPRRPQQCAAVQLSPRSSPAPPSRRCRGAAPEICLRAASQQGIAYTHPGGLTPSAEVREASRTAQAVSAGSGA